MSSLDDTRAHSLLRATIGALDGAGCLGSDMSPHRSHRPLSQRQGAVADHQFLMAVHERQDTEKRMDVDVDECCSSSSVEHFLPINFTDTSVSVGGHVLECCAASKAEQETKHTKVDPQERSSSVTSAS